MSPDPLFGQEFNADIIITSPTVPFKARLVADPDEEMLVSNPSLFPEPSEVRHPLTCLV